jgi:alanine racemase
MTPRDDVLHPSIAAALSDPSEAGGVLTIDLAAIAANWRMLAGMTVPAECAAVVKAGAYGCGLDQVTRTLAKAGCKTFFVADVAEGRQVRAAAPEAVIYILNGVLPDTAPALAEAHLRPVINSIGELAEWDGFVSASNWRGGAALHVDTGMNRLGLTAQEAAAVAPRVQSKSIVLTLLMSHLACADTPDHPMNAQQMRRFGEVRAVFGGVPASLANSAGIFHGAAAHCELVRPGIALYGGNPVLGRPNPLRPVVDLKGRIVQIRTVQPGETVGYGADWTAARPSRVAIIAVGYGDGYMRVAATAGRAATNVVIAGKACPLVGRVSMDLMAADITDVPTGNVRRGDLATLIGEGVDIDAVASLWGTIGYEVLTSLGRRYHRVYKGS